MSDVIDAAKENGQEIMRAVRDSVNDAAFGVATLADYPGLYGDPGDYPWRLDQSITNDINQVQSVIQGLELYSGGDTPESYARAFYESLFIEWRPGAKRVIVLFADSPAHDPDFYSEDYGIDPGPDEEIGTIDDIFLSGVIEALAEMPITVIPINSDLSGNLDTRAGLDYVSRETGGQLFEIGAASDAPDAVIEGLDATVERISNLTAELSGEPPDWVTLVGGEYSDVGGGETAAFGLEIDPPEGTVGGDYSFNVLVTADGALLAEIPVDITIGGSSIELSSLLDKKREIISFMLSPETELEILDITVPFATVEGYGTSEENVRDWLESISDDESAATLGAVSRLLSQEDGLKRLWIAGADTSNVAGKNIGNIVLVGWSGLNLFKFLKRPDIAHRGMRGLTTKVRNKLFTQINIKLVDAVTWAIDFLLNQLPNQEDPSIRDYRAILHGTMAIAKEAIDEGAGLQDLVSKGLVPLAVVDGASKSHIIRTTEYVNAGLSATQAYAAFSTTREDAIANASEAEASKESLLLDIEGGVNNLNDQARELEKVQALAKVAADVADAGALLAAAGVVTSAVAVLAKVVAIVSRVIDASTSGYLVGHAGLIWWQLPGTAQEVTRVVFPGAYTARKTDAYSLGKLAPEVAVFETATLNYAQPLELELDGASDDYIAALQEIRNAVNVGDPDNLELALDPLVEADRELDAAMRTAQAPAMVAAGSPELGADLNWQQAYSDMAAGYNHFSLDGALLYLYMYGYLSDPEDEVIKSNLLTSISDVEESVTESREAIANILPLTSDFVTRPIITISEISYPDELLIGDAFDLGVTLDNAVPLVAESVTVQLIPQAGLELIGAEVLEVGQIVEMGNARASYPLRITDEEGIATLVTSSGNGLDQTRSVVILASDESVLSESDLPDEPLATSSSFPERGNRAGVFLVILGLLSLGVLGLFIYTSRGRHNAGPSNRAQAAVPLLIIGSGSQARSTQIWDGMVIGRGNDADFRIADSAVSRRHAQVRFVDSVWYIRDLESTFGTFVNDQQVQVSPLNGGDHIRLGDTELIVRINR